MGDTESDFGERWADRFMICGQNKGKATKVQSSCRHHLSVAPPFDHLHNTPLIAYIFFLIEFTHLSATAELAGTTRMCLINLVKIGISSSVSNPGP